MTYSASGRQQRAATAAAAARAGASAGPGDRVIARLNAASSGHRDARRIRFCRTRDTLDTAAQDAESRHTVAERRLQSRGERSRCLRVGVPTIRSRGPCPAAPPTPPPPDRDPAACDAHDGDAPTCGKRPRNSHQHTTPASTPNAIAKAGALLLDLTRRAPASTSCWSGRSTGSRRRRGAQRWACSRLAGCSGRRRADIQRWHRTATRGRPPKRSHPMPSKYSSGQAWRSSELTVNTERRRSTCRSPGWKPTAIRDGMPRGGPSQPSPRRSARSTRPSPCRNTASASIPLPSNPSADRCVLGVGEGRRPQVGLEGGLVVGAVEYRPRPPRSAVCGDEVSGTTSGRSSDRGLTWAPTPGAFGELLQRSAARRGTRPCTPARGRSTSVLRTVSPSSSQYQEFTNPSTRVAGYGTGQPAAAHLRHLHLRQPPHPAAISGTEARRDPAKSVRSPPSPRSLMFGPQISPVKFSQRGECQ